MVKKAETQTNSSQALTEIKISRNIFSGTLFGLGLAAFIDETVFHQLLHWHHFYDKSTTTIGLISDGFFHAFSWFATIGSLFLLANLKQRNTLIWRLWWASVLIGCGGFQLYDGTIQHKLMRLHQIRYVENVWVYDVVWNIIAIGMIATGLILFKKTIKLGGF